MNISVDSRGFADEHMPQARLTAPAPGQPTEQELGRVLLSAAATVVAVHHNGGPPPGLDREDLAQEIVLRTLPRARYWRPGGPKRLDEYCYVLCYNALRSLQHLAHARLLRCAAAGLPASAVTLSPAAPRPSRRSSRGTITAPR